MTTHVICTGCTESEFKSYKKYSNVHVINQNFVLRSLKYKSKVLEENFEIKPVPDPIPDSNSFQKKMSSYNSYT